MPVPIPSVLFNAAPLAPVEGALDVGLAPEMVEAIPVGDPPLAEADADIEGPVWTEQFVKGQVAEDWT